MREHETRELGVCTAEEKRSPCTLAQAPSGVDPAALAHRADVGNVDRACAAIQRSTDFNLLSNELLGLLLIVQLVVRIGGLQHVLAACLYHGSSER